MDVDFVKYLSGKSSKLLKVKHHDIPGVINLIKETVKDMKIYSKAYIHI